MQGKRVLVTGGSRGIGKAICKLLAAAGAHIFFTYRHDQIAAENTLKELPGEVHSFGKLDLSENISIPELILKATEHLGGLDVLINNAGIYAEHDPLTTNYYDWVSTFESMIQCNLNGPAHLSHQAFQIFKTQGGGRIINIGSRGAYRGEPAHPGYAAAKAGLHALSQSLARAGAAHQIYSFAIAPGFVSTDMAKPILDGAEGDSIRNQSPTGRVAKPEEVANAVLYFASGQGDFSTGCVLDINGASYLR